MKLTINHKRKASSVRENGLQENKRSYDDL